MFDQSAYLQYSAQRKLLFGSHCMIWPLECSLSSHPHSMAWRKMEFFISKLLIYLFIYLKKKVTSILLSWVFYLHRRRTWTLTPLSLSFLLLEFPFPSWGRSSLPNFSLDLGVWDGELGIFPPFRCELSILKHCEEGIKRNKPGDTWNSQLLTQLRTYNTIIDILELIEETLTRIDRLEDIFNFTRSTITTSN